VFRGRADLGIAEALRALDAPHNEVRDLMESTAEAACEIGAAELVTRADQLLTQ